ncbi:hypothetical protein GJ496_002305 [Pomphorhynchus laevis]|nr:hypothetical protein GJ496_002305 [Pomphorhynchus laevis]
MKNKKLKNRYNKKARLLASKFKGNDINEVEIENLDTKNGYDDANCFALPNKHRKCKDAKKQHLQQDATPQPLSNRKRKILKKILDRKSRKQDRKEVLEKLRKHKLSDDNRDNIIPIAELGNYLKSIKKPKKVRLNVDFELDSKLDLVKLDEPTKNNISQITGQSKLINVNETISSTSEDHCVYVKKPTSGYIKNQVECIDDKTRNSDQRFIVTPQQPLRNENNEHYWTSSNDFYVSDASDVELNVESVQTIESDQVAHATQENNLAACQSDTNQKILSKDANKDGSFDICTKRYILVERPKEIQISRSKLPIINEEHTIMEAVHDHDIVLVCGQTGSGKTTQVPQFLYEYGFTLSGKKIGITEPRRTAARQMSFKVADELCLPKTQVSFQTRFGGNVSEDTIIKFMTDGILLREIYTDRNLSNYSAIILDEAHERSIFSDILIGLLTKIVDTRRNSDDGHLKVIIMSATLEHANFTENKLLFPDHIPPVISVDSRQFPVEIRFLSTTPDDYVESCFNVVQQIHCTEPEGGILVFVTGKLHISQLCAKLRTAFPKQRENINHNGNKDNNAPSQLNPKALNNEVLKLKDLPIEPTNLQNELHPLRHNDDDDELSNWKSIEDQPLHILPLHATLKDSEQQRVFKPVPEGCRLCVISTNVSEVSLTIPNIKYVVDSGKVKTRIYNRLAGYSKFNVQWISKASAEQRAGRAGRTCNGICFRLYSSVVFNDQFPDHPIPEIQRIPLEEVVMQMKSMNLDIDIHKFPYPTPPPEDSLKAAERLLIMLNLIEVDNQCNASLTKLGRIVSRYPLNPRHGKMLVIAKHFGVFDYALLLASVMTVSDYFLQGSVDIREQEGIITKSFGELRRNWLGKNSSYLPLGDFMLLMIAQETYERIDSVDKKRKFCESYGIRMAAAEDAVKLRRQLRRISLQLFENEVVENNEKCSLSPINEEQSMDLRKSILCGMIDKLARKNPDVVKQNDKLKKNSYLLVSNDRPAWIHSSSSLHEDLPEYIIYQDLIENDDCLFMHEICVIDPKWIPVFAQRLCTFDDPSNICYDECSGRVVCTRDSCFVPGRWSIPNVDTPYPVDDNRIYKHFASFILDGQMFPKLAKFKSKLLTTPCIVSKNVSRGEDHDNAKIGFIDDVGDSNYVFINYRKVDNHGKAEVEFIGDIVESDDDLIDYERN